MTDARTKESTELRKGLEVVEERLWCLAERTMREGCRGTLCSALARARRLIIESKDTPQPLEFLLFARASDNDIFAGLRIDGRSGFRLGRKPLGE